jgi:hypothetical protein
LVLRRRSNDGSTSSKNDEADRNETDGNIGYVYEANFYVINNDNSIPSAITEPFVYDVSGSDSNFGSIWLYTYNYTLGYQTTFAYADMHVSTLTVSEVPEPSTWAMLLIGFAGLGYAGYRRAKRNSPAFADWRA